MDRAGRIRRVGCVGAALGAALALALGAGCIEERTRAGLSSRGVPLRAGAAPKTKSAPRPATPKAELPEGPIAERAPGAAKMTARVSIAVQPLGAIPFDGQVLPIVSPDGRFIATQTGEAPEWPVLLAQGDASPPRTTIEVYELTDAGPRAVPAVEPLPEGLLLGRSADDRGVLVEQVLEGGARRLGLLRWASGAIEWLDAAKDGIAAHGVLTASGLVFTSRRTGETEFTLAWAGAGSVGAATQRFGCLSPAVGASGEVVYTLACGAAGLALAAWARPAGIADAGWTVRAASAVLGPSADAVAAYQAVSSVQTHPVCVTSDRPPPPRELLFHHPFAKRMALFDASSGQVVMLTAKSISGGWMHEAGSGWGVLLTTPGGLVHQRLARDREGVLTPGEAVRLLDQPFVPRATCSADRPVILIGPDRASATPRLQVMVLRAGSAVGEP